MIRQQLKKRRLKRNLYISLEILRSLTDAGKLIVITTHDLILAYQADRLILLGLDGVIADGSTENILDDAAAWQKAGIELPNWFIRKKMGAN